MHFGRIMFQNYDFNAILSLLIYLTLVSYDLANDLL